MQRVRARKSALAWPSVLGLFLIVLGSVPALVEAGCPGCCSWHGGISDSCALSGRVICKDGTVSPSCTCSRCGISPAPDPDPILEPSPDPVPDPLTFGDCLSEFPNNTPPVVDVALGQQRDLCFDSFAVLHSGESKTPLFVAEHLNRDRLLDAADEERTDYFYAEARLPSAERAQLSDYAGSGYDRGHMAPAADMPNPNAMAQSFSLANIVPQDPTLNRGLWAEIEDHTRDYVWDWDAEVYVFTGPVFIDPITTIGTSPVYIPNHIYKLVYDSERNQAWAYWVDNLDEEDRADRISYETLVERTGIDFLPGLTPDFVWGIEDYYRKVNAYFQGTLGRSATIEELAEWGGVLRDNKGSVWKPQGAGLQHYLSNEMGWGTAPLDRETATAMVSEIFGNLFGTLDDLDPYLTSFYADALVNGSVKPRGSVNAILNDLAIMPRVDGSYGKPNGWEGGPGNGLLTNEQLARYRERVEEVD